MIPARENHPLDLVFFLFHPLTSIKSPTPASVYMRITSTGATHASDLVSKELGDMSKEFKGKVRGRLG